MLDLTPESAEEDAEFVRMRETVREYATMYVMAKGRHKGCDGMGELAMAKEEFRDSLHALIDYCKKKGYISEDFHYDIDRAGDALAN